MNETLGITNLWIGYVALVVFFVAYILVMLEEQTHLRKSKPVLAAAGVIWVLIAVYANKLGIHGELEQRAKESFLEYAELFFFLLVAMAYVNAMLERGVFDELRNLLVKNHLGYKALFWLTGILAFFISAFANNLTTALIMCAVVMTCSGGKKNFVAISCINIVVASNAGGTFSPFGDITTLMVWQKGIVEFQEFFVLFLPALVNFLVPAFIMQFFLPRGIPQSTCEGTKHIEPGGLTILFFFILTIVTAVAFHSFLNLPPVMGMLLGLSYLKFYSYYLQLKSKHWSKTFGDPPGSKDDPYDFDVFNEIAKSEWDTLFFFYGVILAVGGLSYIGYLEFLSEFIYGEFGATTANILVGVMSAIVDNIPVMFAVLTMNPDMSQPQWLLVTLTAGVGGSLLSIGSAAGVALMGQAKGYYTFMGHLKWMPVISLGYAASIAVHFALNGI